MDDDRFLGSKYVLKQVVAVELYTLAEDILYDGLESWRRFVGPAHELAFGKRLALFALGRVLVGPLFLCSPFVCHDVVHFGLYGCRVVVSFSFCLFGQAGIGLLFNLLHTLLLGKMACMFVGPDEMCVFPACEAPDDKAGKKDGWQEELR